ncbi:MULTISPECIES: outer membrane protein assembly factor BamD [unclassified Undibacterium]|uniref:outer membrane protein assembly factor BamD n=1 Tax=unclassified Undibacterium TaxID=2630295 RepID=UPI002AC936AA|nr:MULTISPECIES: outer membrane protein assembly factor BamD [unclassified Undibacterium]MEB0141154.1 outer membrane protein assembly factor BamD [Undibacterium sp. CCC2.1]MEB0174187.1 outer membrane protein assembly factor BamD [Undibacterium sp. CCC1.1]MEB0178135.1 outer membrane protein assembly factor BamD [Undibacterium sp. CCC3.4]MEB0217332.1 outer membrane protein assembly factor BamD [Undibacterium sp. 5I2]WPX43274.1 outer membrane protein assembly factor BamD [Undibacterium sp. CCC3.4
MHIKSLKLLVLALATSLSLGGCGVFSDKADETKTWSASKLYAEAKDEMSNGGYEKAIQYFEKLESRFPFGTYAQQAQMDTAYAYYKQGDQAQALAAVERFLKLHPNHANVDYMYYLRGLISFNDQLGLMNFLANQDITERDPKASRDSFDAFKQLATQFPDSKYTPDAIARMKYLVNALAQYDVHVARYYLRRGAYLAAANRAQSAITEYPNAPSTEEALYILVKSYDAMGMIELRDDANRVFTKNFPQSAFVNGTQKQNKVWWKFWN